VDLDLHQVMPEMQQVNKGGAGMHQLNKLVGVQAWE
jgi:hypothetical protein